MVVREELKRDSNCWPLPFLPPKPAVSGYRLYFVCNLFRSQCRIESKNTLAHLVKVDDCFELRLHWGRELQVGNGRRIGRRFVWFCYGFASFLFYRWWAFAFALPRTRIQLKKTQQEKQRNKTRKGTTKQERGKQTRSKDKKKEVWESKWAILISLEVKIYACQSTCPI